MLHVWQEVTDLTVTIRRLPDVGSESLLSYLERQFCLYKILDHGQGREEKDT